MLSMGLASSIAAAARGDQVNSLYSLRSKPSEAQSAIAGVREQPSRVEITPSGPRTTSNYLGQKNGKAILKSSWITVSEPTPREFKVNDLVTIVVNEVSKNTTKADTKSDREMDYQAKVADWIGFHKKNLVPDKQAAGDPTIGLNSMRNLEGKNDIKREDTLSTRVQAKIIDIMPNGNLYLEATHLVVTDEESTEITLTGECRSQDIGVDNSIISTKVANLNVKKMHKGIAHDTNKRGWLLKIYDVINPF
jgi:flagellar L-ring protein FlgH